MGMTTTVDEYLTKGCGRCPLGNTPNCKVHRWVEELQLLRNMVLETDLSEVSKWGVPCYTFKDRNVIIISAFVNHCAISFFKGALLKDERKILEKPGMHSQAVRMIRFRSVEEIESMRQDLRDYILEAIGNEKAGKKVDYRKNPEPIPLELEQKFNEDPVFKNAFESLTPGRQRGYILYFSAPKQSKTRISRIEKCIGKILNGEGLHDKYGKN